MPSSLAWRSVSVWSIGWILALLLLTCASVGFADRRETAIKAAFVYNFIQFVEWPQGALADDEYFVIGILGADPFEGALEAIAQEQEAYGRPIRVLRLRDVSEVAGCHMVFVSQRAHVSPQEFFQAVQGRPVLTVSDAERFARRGGMIGLLTEGNRVRLEINTDAVRGSGLNLSSRLLRLATVVSTSDG